MPPSQRCVRLGNERAAEAGLANVQGWHGQLGPCRRQSAMCFPVRGRTAQPPQCVVQTSNSGRQLLWPPADWCPTFASRATHDTRSARCPVCCPVAPTLSNCGAGACTLTTRWSLHPLAVQRITQLRSTSPSRPTSAEPRLTLPKPSHYGTRPCLFSYRAASVRPHDALALHSFWRLQIF